MAIDLERTTKPDEHELADWSPEGHADVLTRAETAECTCPEFCERDHDNE
jgi:hypothetical protein